MDERRTHPRLRVQSGTAMVEPLHSGSPIPAGKARVVDWSRGGVMLALESELDPVRFRGEWLVISVRIPPRNVILEVHARITNARRLSGGPVLLLGACFDLWTADLERLGEMVQLLEGRGVRTSSAKIPAVGVARPQVQDDSQALGRQSHKLAEASQRLGDQSRRLEDRARQLAISGQREESRRLAQDAKALRLRSEELARESCLIAARCQQAADLERRRAVCA